MNQSWIYMCSPSRSPLPPPSPSHPSGSSHCTIPEHLSHASNLGWWSISPLTVYLFQCGSLSASHPCLLRQSLKVLGAYLNGLWQTVFVLSWSYYLLALCPGTLPSVYFSWEQEVHVSRVFWKDYQSWVQRIYTFVVNDVCFPPNVLVWKTCQPTYISSWYFQKYICVK